MEKLRRARYFSKSFRLLFIPYIHVFPLRRSSVKYIFGRTYRQAIYVGNLDDLFIFGSIKRVRYESIEQSALVLVNSVCLYILWRVSIPRLLSPYDSCTGFFRFLTRFSFRTLTRVVRFLFYYSVFRVVSICSFNERYIIPVVVHH